MPVIFQKVPNSSNILLICTGSRTAGIGFIFDLCSSFEKSFLCYLYIWVFFRQVSPNSISSLNDFSWLDVFISEKFCNNVLHDLRVKLLQLQLVIWYLHILCPTVQYPPNGLVAIWKYWIYPHIIDVSYETGLSLY